MRSLARVDLLVGGAGWRQEPFVDAGAWCRLSFRFKVLPLPYFLCSFACSVLCSFLSFFLCSVLCSFLSCLLTRGVR
eukprot:1004584-Rhodomonas_salina.1